MKVSSDWNQKKERTKKSAPKPGRKKSKKSDPTPSGANTLRTRAAVAREQAASADVRITGVSGPRGGGGE